MDSKMVTVVWFLIVCSSCHAFSNEEYGMESRGKKKKIALFVFFADLIIKKIFVLKLIYAFIFFVVLHKAGYFLTWFASYLKEKKHEFHYDPYYKPSFEIVSSYETSKPLYGPSKPIYGPSYGPYRRDAQGL